MFERILDLVLPVQCVSCRADGTALCAGCAEACMPQPRGAAPAHPPPGFPHTVGAVAYAGVPRRVLIGYKEHGRRGLAPVLAGQLFAAVRSVACHGAGRDRVGLVPIPTLVSARRRRGGDHLLPLVRAVCRRSGRFRLATLLRPATHRVDSVGLNAAQRRRNISGAFAIRRHRLPFAGQLVLVDDVVTSGATLAEAARTLRAAGFAVAGAAVIAAMS